MSQMIFPPNNWAQTVNTIDTIVLEYNSTYSAVTLTLFCERVKGIGDWIWWTFKGPLPANATYNLYLDFYRFTDYINIFPTNCHFEIANAKNGTQKVNVGNIPISTFKNKAETTWSRSTPSASVTNTATSTITTSTRSTLPSPTNVSSGTLQTSISTTPTAIPISSDDHSSQGLSPTARLGLGLGVGLGVTVVLILAFFAIILYRKRRLRKKGPGKTSSEPARFEKAELPGDTIPNPQHAESQVQLVNLSSQTTYPGSHYSDTSHQSQWGSQELPAVFPYTHSRIHDLNPGQRYELRA